VKIKIVLDASICVLTILLVAMVLTPVFATVKAKSSEDGCASNLHALGRSLLLYREEYPHGISGTAAEMGLPTGLAVAQGALPALKTLRCSAATGDTAYRYGYVAYFTGSKDSLSEKYWQAYTSQESSIVAFADPNHSRDGNPVNPENPHLSKHVLGIDLAETLRVKDAKGDWESPLWWRSNK
jgi:hypothetical protein